jgi:hypothetical protein
MHEIQRAWILQTHATLDLHVWLSSGMILGTVLRKTKTICAHAPHLRMGRSPDGNNDSKSFAYK